MNRRQFLAGLGASIALPVAGSAGGAGGGGPPRGLTLFLAGDVMLGRGIDQVLPHSVDPTLHEGFVKDARRYVELAEREHGEIDAPVSYRYVWGDALAELDRVDPEARIINLETAVTTSDSPWPRKGIHYRMHPGNVPVLTAAGIEVCGLGNNHVLDWGREGLRETLAALRDAGIAAPGAGLDATGARTPARVETARGTIRIHAYGMPSAGVPSAWEAAAEPGVNLLASLDEAAARRVVEELEGHREPGDRVVVSIHWGSNWGYDIPTAQRRFAHRLVEAGAADVVLGHSSHHPKGMEVYGGRPILYGAGDFLNDYEGIGGREAYRGDLTLMYFPTLAPSGELVRLRMTPIRISRFRLERASSDEADWLAETLDRESRPLGAAVERVGKHLELRWG